MRSPLSIVGGLVLATLAGCQTAPMTGPSTIGIPGGLTEPGVEVAIASYLTVSAERGRGLDRSDPGMYERLQASALGEALIEQYRRSPMRRRGWYLQSWSPGDLRAVLRRKSYHVEISFRIANGSVVSEIVGSHNLDQANGRIHKNVLVWHQDLLTDIRDALGRAASIEPRLRTSAR